MKTKKDIQKQINFMIDEIIDFCINNDGMFDNDFVKKEYKEKWNDFGDWIYE